MCALIYQVAWIREFRLVFGGATPAAGAVMAVFMAGLGLGNAVLGKQVDRRPNPLRFYAQLELAIAAFAAATPLAIDLVRAIYIATGGQETLGLGMATLLRLGLTAAVLGLPTIAMGGTLAAAVRSVTTADDQRRTAAAVVYGFNTLGAVSGVLFGTFLSLEALGTRTTVWLAVGVNLVIAAIAFGLSRGTEIQSDTDVTSEGSVTEPDKRSRPKSINRRTARNRQHDARDISQAPLPHYVVYLASAIVGFAFFLMELVWFRMLSPLLSGSTYTFGVILALMLLGIGLGGLLYPLIARYRQPTALLFAITCLLEAITMAIPFALGDQLAIWAAMLREQTSHSFSALVAGWAVIGAIVVLPASLVSGWQFPLLIALLGQGRQDVGREVGLTFAANTLGAIVGSLVGGFGILPWLSAPGAWLFVVGLLTLLGVAVALREAVAVRGLRPALLPLLLAGLAALLAQRPGPSAAWRHSAVGGGRSTLPKQYDANSIREWVHLQQGRMVWEADGVDASVALSASNNGLAFHVNGKCDGSAMGDAGTQIMAGILGAMLHGHPERALIVGLGTGETAGWLAEVDSIRNVDVVEIEPAIRTVAEYCAAGNFNVLEHPKVAIRYNDAREYLLTCPYKYDVVFSEPSNPFRVGIASLFTREFYQAVHQRLNTGGVFIQWLQAYEIDEKSVQMVLETAQSAFPHVEVWVGTPTDMLIVCSEQLIDHDVASMRKLLAKEPFRSAARLGWNATELESVLAHYVCGRATVDEIRSTPPPPAITDDRNLLEYRFARTVGKTGGFDADQLRRIATRRGDARISTSDTEIDWQLVQDSQFYLYGSLPGVVPDAACLTRKKALDLFPEDCRSVIRVWESQPRAPQLLHEVTSLAQAYALLQPEKAKPLIAKLALAEPTSAKILTAQLISQEGRDAEAQALLLEAFRELHVNPWIQILIAKDSFTLAWVHATRSPEFARELYAVINRPLALGAFEETRREHELRLAFLIGPQTVQASLAVSEPIVPWNEEFLRARAEAYSLTASPWAARAEADLQAFYENRR